MSHPVDFQGATPTGIPRRVLLGIVLIVAVVAVSIAKPWDSGPAPTAGPTPPPSAAIATSRSAAPAAPTPSASLGLGTRFILDPPTPIGVPWAGMHWIPLRPDSAEATLTAVAPWSDGWVALGRDGDRGAPSVWASRDGAVWTRAPGGRTGFWPGALVLAVAPVPSGLIAVAAIPMAACDPACPADAPLQLTVWSSRDGLAWDPIGGTLLDTLRDVTGDEVQLAGGPVGLVLTVTPPSAGAGRAASRLYASRDGVSWLAVPALPNGFSAASASATSTALLLTGSVQQHGATVAAIARSVDLRRWTVSVLPAAPDLPQPQTAWAIRVAPSGLLAQGSAADVNGTELWWRSVDGAAWTAAPGYQPLGTSCATPSPCGVAADGIVIGDGRRLLALQLHPAWRAWTSSGDGQWSLLAGQDPGPPGTVSRALLLPGGAVVTTADGAWYGRASTRTGG